MSHHPALPLRHRHGYPAATSPWPPDPGCTDPAWSSPPVMRGGCAPPTSPNPPGFRAGTRSRGVTQPVSLVYLPVSLTAPDPSGSAGTTRLCRGCSRPPRRPAAQAASSFTPPLRRPGDRGLPPPFGQSEVGPGRPASVAAGGSPRTASRTRRAPLSAPGSPQAPGAGALPHAVLGHGAAIFVPR